MITTVYHTASCLDSLADRQQQIKMNMISTIGIGVRAAYILDKFADIPRIQKSS